MDAKQDSLKEEGLFADLSDVFKIFADETRLKILYALFDEEHCVFEISEMLSMSQSAISHQLRILKDSKLIACKRNGKAIIYQLVDEHVRSIIAQGYEHLSDLNTKSEKE